MWEEPVTKYLTTGLKLRELSVSVVSCLRLKPVASNWRAEPLMHW
jgi:hypothetical protein